MSSPENNKTGFWSWVGKIAVLLGVILASFQVYERFTNKGIQIVATGYNSRFYLPDNIVEAIIESEKPIESTEVLKSLPETVPEREKVAATVATNLTNPIAKRVMEDKKKELLGSFVTIHDFTEILVKNEGDKEATDLKFECDGCKGFYRLGLSENSSFKDFNGSISLGTLRPANTLNLTVWLDYGLFSSARIYDTRITHPNGVVAIEYPYRFWGWKAWIANNFILMAFLLGVLIVALLILVGRGAMKYGASNPAEAMRVLQGRSLERQENDSTHGPPEQTVLLQVAQNPPNVTIAVAESTESFMPPRSKTP